MFPTFDLISDDNGNLWSCEYKKVVSDIVDEIYVFADIERTK